MKLTIVSDLHLESDPYFTLWKGPDVKERTLILAGDIIPLTYIVDDSDSIFGEQGIKFFNTICKNFKHVVYVPGNHEYYHGDINILDDKFRIAIKQHKWDNLHYLNENCITLDGQKFIGCALWTDINNEDPIAMSFEYKNMADYYAIRSGDNPFTPTMSVGIHKSHLRFIKRNLEEGAIIVTHYPPSEQSIAEKFKGNKLNPFFYNNLDDLVIRSKAKMWIHGHTHSHMDYKIQNTNIICNPKGYFNPYKYDEPENPYYDDTRIFEV